MSASNMSGSGLSNARDWEGDPRHWVAVGFAVLIALIALSVAFSIIAGIWHGTTTMWTMNGMGADWVPGLVFGLVILWILFWLVSGFLWRVSSPYWGTRHDYHGHWRYHGRWAEPSDPAFAVARERYARGEISKDQYEQLARDLGYPSGSPLPP